MECSGNNVYVPLLAVIGIPLWLTCYDREVLQHSLVALASQHDLAERLRTRGFILTTLGYLQSTNQSELYGLDMVPRSQRCGVGFRSGMFTYPQPPWSRISQMRETDWQGSRYNCLYNYRYKMAALDHAYE